MQFVRLSLAFTLLLVSACASNLPTDACGPPPASELSAESDLVMTVQPNPVDSGTSATLSTDTSGQFAGRVVGIGAELQCWDGAQWKPLFLVTRDKKDLPSTIHPVIPGQTTVVPAIGIPLPDISRILIPDVPDGVYRIEDHTEDSNSHVSGFVIVYITK